MLSEGIVSARVVLIAQMQRVRPVRKRFWSTACLNTFSLSFENFNSMTSLSISLGEVKKIYVSIVHWNAVACNLLSWAISYDRLDIIAKKMSEWIVSARVVLIAQMQSVPILLERSCVSLLVWKLFQSVWKIVIRMISLLISLIEAKRKSSYLFFIRIALPVIYPLDITQQISLPKCCLNELHPWELSW